MLEWKGLHGFSNEICLKALSWNCQVNHLHCILKSEQIYLNTSTYPVEAVYTFALPRGAVVTNFAIDIGGKHLQAQVAKTQQAAERYEQAIDDDDMPALLEHSEDGLCTLNIGGIAPNETVLIQITCEWMQERVGDIVRVTVPTVIGDRYSRNGSQGQLLPHQQVETSAFAEYPIKAHFEFIGQEYENARFSAPGFSPICTFIDGGAAIDIAHGFADRDLVITAENVGQLAYSYLLEDDGQYRGVAVLPIPKLSDEAFDRSLSLSLVVDCSGSMVGSAIDEAKRALTSLPNLLTEKDRLTLTLFGSEPQVVFRKAQACTKAFFRRDYIPRVSEINADLGGTEMAAALKAAAEHVSGPTDVLLMTDGEIWETDECIELAKRHGLRVFVIGIGNAANGHFCHSIAAATGGATEMVLPTEDMTAVMTRMIQRTRRPTLLIENFTPMHSQYRSHPLKQLHADETLILFFRFSKLPGQIPMFELYDGNNRARVEGAPWKLSGNRGLLMIAANAELADGLVDDPADFAARYSLLSEWTSLILVHEREAGRKATIKPRFQRIPQMETKFSLSDIKLCIFRREQPAEESRISYCRGPEFYSRDQDLSDIPDLEAVVPELSTSRDTDQTEKEVSIMEAPREFWLCVATQYINFEFESQRDRNRLNDIATEEYKSVNLIFFYYLLWLEETRHVPLPKELVEYKYHPALRLNDEDKKELWDKFSKSFD